MGAIFKKFGFHLECPETGIKIFSPETLSANHDYKKGTGIPVSLDFLNVSWNSKLTESNINKSCALCGSSLYIEMHHLRKVKDIRQKIRTGNSTFSE
jgi:hypothetical protein